MIGINGIDIDDMDLSGSLVFVVSAEKPEGDCMRSMENDFRGCLTAQKLFFPPKLFFIIN